MISERRVMVEDFCESYKGLRFCDDVRDWEDVVCLSLMLY